MLSLKWFGLLQQGQLIVLALGFVLLLVAETLAPEGPVRAWRERVRHVGRNAGLWIVSTLVLSLVTGSMLIGFALWLEANRIGLFNLVAVPMWLVFVGGFLALDLADYIFHRLSHQWRWLWLSGKSSHYRAVTIRSARPRGDAGASVQSEFAKRV